MGYLFKVTLITFIFDSFIIFFTRKSANASKVAIVRLDAIGDFVLWLDAAKEFRKFYPNRKIILIANDVWVSLAERLPYWDEIIPIHRMNIIRNPIYRAKMLRRIRKLGIEKMIQPAYSREFRFGDSLIRASGASEKIGSVGDLSNITAWEEHISNKWYSRLFPAPQKPLMELQRNAEFIKVLGVTNFRCRVPVLPSMAPLRRELAIEQPYFVIFPGASWPGKQWPAEKFGYLILKVKSLISAKVVLCGSREERALCDAVIEASNQEGLNLAGETSLPELAEVLRKAKFLVGTDTSAIHIATAVGTPSVCILGGGHYGRFVPYVVDQCDGAMPIPVIHKMDCFGCNWQCIYNINIMKHVLPCINEITVDDVWSALSGIIREHSSRYRNVTRALMSAEGVGAGNDGDASIGFDSL